MHFVQILFVREELNRGIHSKEALQMVESERPWKHTLNYVSDKIHAQRNTFPVIGRVIHSVSVCMGCPTSRKVGT